MNGYREIYEEYLKDELYDIEALEKLLLLCDVRNHTFWVLLKARKFWSVNKELSRRLDNQLNDYLK
jgi:hypothetical protein